MKGQRLDDDCQSKLKQLVSRNASLVRHGFDRCGIEQDGLTGGERLDIRRRDTSPVGKAS